MVWLNACIDTVNDIIWAPLSHQLTMSVNLQNLQSGQTMPDACAMITEQEATIPAYSKSVNVCLNMRPGQTLNSTLNFFQPFRTCLKLELTLEATPFIEVSSRAVYVLFNNCMAQDIHVPKASHLGWLMNQAFHDFELTVPVIGPIPAQLTSDECNDIITFTKPHEIIAITSILSRESVCRSELTDDTHLAVYAVSTQRATESPTRVTIEAQSLSNDQTDAFAKAGALHGESWTFHALPPNPSVAAVTRRQHTPATSHIAISPQFAADNLLTLQNADSSRFGLPLGVNSDHGTHFTAEIMQEVWKLLGIQAKLHISHHPISSSQVVRANRTVVSMLKKYVSTNQKDWDIKLPLVLMAARATPHQSTGVPPFTLMTGRNMTLPLHLLYQPGDLNLVTAYTTHQYLEELHEHLRTTFAFAQKQLQRSAEGRKAYYDLKASHHELNVGDKVWYYSFARPRQNAPHHLSRKFLPHWTEAQGIADKLSPVAFRIKISHGSIETR